MFSRVWRYLEAWSCVFFHAFVAVACSVVLWKTGGFLDPICQ